MLQYERNGQWKTFGSQFSPPLVGQEIEFRPSGSESGAFTWKSPSLQLILIYILNQIFLHLKDQIIW